MKEFKTISDVVTAYENNEFVVKIKKEIDENTVIDENETVKWNREKVKELNGNIAKENEIEKNKKTLTSAFIEAIVNEWDLTKSSAAKVVSFVNSKHSGSFDEFADELNDILNLLEDLEKE